MVWGGNVAPMVRPSLLLRCLPVCGLLLALNLAGCSAVQVVSAPASLARAVVVEGTKVTVSGVRATGRVTRRAVGGSGRVASASVGAGTTAAATTIGTGATVGSVAVGTTTTAGGVALGTTATVGGMAVGTTTTVGGVAAGSTATTGGIVASHLTNAGVRTATRVSAATLQSSGRVAASGVRATGAVASSSIDALARLAREGMITFVDGQTGSILRIPWRAGLNLYGGTAIAHLPLASRAIQIVRAGRLIYRVAQATSATGVFQLNPGDVVQLLDGGG